MNSPDPEIKFTAYNCPFCGNEAGPKSDCHTSRNKDKIFSTGNGNIINVFSPSCVFKAEYVYWVDINYYFSQPLLDKIVEIEGVSKITPAGPYRFQVNIGSMFRPEEIKKKIAIAYRTFVKEILVKNLEKDEKFPKKITIILPNDRQQVFEPASYSEYVTQKAIVDGLVLEFPGTKLIEE